MYTDIACVAAPRICPPGARAKMPINSCASPKIPTSPVDPAVEGGYGANSLTTRVEVGAGETMLDHSIIALYRMLGKLKDTPSQ